MTEPLTPATFDENARAALTDTVLRGALRRATDTFSERRSSSLQDMPDWEALRERGRLVKEHTLAHLDHYLSLFVERAEAAGVRVHWARDGEEACRKIGEICGSEGSVVKSKSMTTEEIHLNAWLEKAGGHPVETDLGEWIIQLAGETPSHIIVPAIHKTREQVGELFRDKLHIPLTSDPEKLTEVARRELRRLFAEADVGITGVNFAIAETGSFLILENEGNIRLTTSLPRVHVAVMGIEKVIPRLSDLAVFLRLLPRSGTGQHLTTYQSIITGPVDQEDGEGPQEVHVVILDNGRSPMLASPVTRQSLACIRCGACLNACPIYQQIGGHAYGSVYPGPIGAIITPQLSGIDKAAKLPFASSLCGACRDVCPVKIDIPQLLLHLRSEIVAGHGPAARAARRPWRERWAFRLWAFAHAGPRRYRWAAWLLCRALRGGKPGRLTRWAAPPLRAWTAARDLRPPAPRTFRSWYATEANEEKPS